MKWINGFWSLFISTKLTVVLLLTLSGTAIFGTLIKQGLTRADYVRQYGEAGFRLFNILGFLDLYHSWWFQALLMFLCINLAACVLERVPLEWRASRRARTPPVPSQLRSYPMKEEINKGLDKGRLKEIISSFSRSVQEFDGPEGTFLLAERGRYRRLGPHVVHVGLLVILIGALTGSFFGFRGTIDIPEGGSSTNVFIEGGRPMPLNFEVQCKSFTVEFYPNSRRPKRFASHLVIVENGRVSADKVIEVNDPLKYKGIVFYQAGYGPAGEPIFTIELVDLLTNKRTMHTVGLREKVPISKDNSYFSIIDFSPNYVPETGGMGHKDLGPTALVALYEGGKMIKRFLIFQNYPDFMQGRGGRFNFVLKGFREAERYYTGLQVTKDPGTWLVWLGCGIMFIGLFHALLSSHRWIWAFIPQDKHSPILVAGKAERELLGFEREFLGLIGLLKKG